MTNGVEARLLQIDWAGPGELQRLDVGDATVDIENEADGTLLIELPIFAGFHPWLGLRLSGTLADETPTFVTASGARQEMLAVRDKADSVWWLQSDRWEEGTSGRPGRHLSQLQRTMGQYEVEIGRTRLRIEAVDTGLGRADLDRYLEDFKAELIWLAMDDASLATSAAGLPSYAYGAELARALQAFAKAVRVTMQLAASEMHETVVVSSPARLRPNIQTFRAHLRDPTATRLPGRAAHASLDIPDNRYLRQMVQRCVRLARAGADAASGARRRLEQLAMREEARATELETSERVPVDPDLFDAELRGVEERMDRIAAYQNVEQVGQNVELTINGAYGRSGQDYFFKRRGEVSAVIEDYDRENGIAYNVVRLPVELAGLIDDARHICREYRLGGSLTAKKEISGNGKAFRLLTAQAISSIVPLTNAVRNKRARRAQLEHENWERSLTRAERDERRQEGQVARQRAETRRAASSAAQGLDSSLSAAARILHGLDGQMARAGIGTQASLPNGMRYVGNPRYAACIAAFGAVQAHAERRGLGEDALEAVERIGVLHASRLYEHWCLVRIISVLIQDLHFAPEAGWQSRIIDAVRAEAHSVQLSLRRTDVPLDAVLEIQPELRNGRRPDFRLTFQVQAVGRRPTNRPLRDTGSNSVLVLDAKFRSRWEQGALDATIRDLVDRKGYDGDDARVFVLHPRAFAHAPSTSPLGWGAHCDHGHRQNVNHRRGAILLSPDGAPGSGQTLLRLVALALQAAFEEPSTEATNSFCVGCGTAHLPAMVKWKRTKRGNDYWEFSCSSCSMKTTRTHCYGCGKTLFKNGFALTYHATRAEAETNVICPSCDAYLDPTWSDDELGNVDSE
jgi:hypothetical protein